MQFGAVILFILLPVEILLPSTILVARQQVSTNNDQVTLAIKQLQATDEAERQAAKKKLLELGASAIPPLLVILKDLDSHRGYIVPDDKEEAKKLKEESLRLGQLEYDVEELLGKLHAEEAIPLLIKIMEERTAFNALEKMCPEMYALVEIGPAAVPKLIESIENAQARARRLDNSMPSLPIQRRAAIVLGRIGDRRALPILERLLKETKLVDFWYAVEQIKTKNKMTK